MYLNRHLSPNTSRWPPPTVHVTRRFKVEPRWQNVGPISVIPAIVVPGQTEPRESVPSLRRRSNDISFHF